MTVCDFHTHCPADRPAILSTATIAESRYTSWEFHPWTLPEKFSVLPENPENLSSFTALGEIGLDRLRGPALAVQQQFLNAFLKLASDYNKPVIFHCVRAFPELFALLKPFSLRWAIHGFRGKAELLNQIWQKGGIVSFHHSIADNPALLAELRRPAGKIAFETDDNSDLDLENIADNVMKKSGNSDLLELANNTFTEFVSNEC